MSSSSASSAEASSWISATSKKLCGGRRISTSATRPLFSTPISLNGPIANLLFGRVAALRLRRAALDDQRIDDSDAIALGMHDHRIEVDLGDGVGVVGGELRQRHHKRRERIDVRFRRTAEGAEQARALQASDQRQRGVMVER